MARYNREDYKTALPQLEKEIGKSLEEINAELEKENKALKEINAQLAGMNDFEEITIQTQGCSLGSYNCCYRIGKIVYLALNFNITTTGSSYDYFTGLPKPIHNWGCTANPTGSVNTERFLISTDGTLRSDGATVTGFVNGSVVYICE